jgi:uncharacterized protein YjaG (DUF416 family)
MKAKSRQLNDFVVDKLTNSITNRISGDIMKAKKIKPELDVDFIQSRPLTDKEEKDLSDFIKKLKVKNSKKKLNAA